MTNLNAVSICARITILMLGVAIAPLTQAVAEDDIGLLAVGDAVVTGFSGVVEPEPKDPPFTKDEVLDETFIDLEGISVRVNNLAMPGHLWDARAWQGEAYFDASSHDVGQVFGVTLDDEKFPNIYVTATSAYGLHRVLPDADNDGRPERIDTGENGADWMEGMWGRADETPNNPSKGGPGSIWKIDGQSGKITLFANVQREGVDNPGAGLGNITYVPQFKQLFVTDLSTGLIHRYDLDGTEIETFDHGVTGRTAANLSPKPFDPTNTPNFNDADFDSEDSETWGFTDEDRRVYALAFRSGRLFYSVVGDNQIWSVGFEKKTGKFLKQARWELDVPKKPKNLPVTDMLFTGTGAMILAQRGDVKSTYDYSNFAAHGKSRVLRYWLETPEDDPNTPSRWIPEPEEYAVGFNKQERSTNGGLALNYGFTKDGFLDTGLCEASLWTTGENLRDGKKLKDILIKGGPLVLDGLQGMPIRPVKQFIKDNNSPPWASYMLDNDPDNTSLVDEDKNPLPYSDTETTGWIGDVAIYRAGCGGAGGGDVAYAGGGWPAGPYYTDDIPHEDTSGPDNPDHIPPPPPPPSGDQCAALKGEFICDRTTGTWIYDGALEANSSVNADKIKLVSTSPGLSIPPGTIFDFAGSGIPFGLTDVFPGQIIGAEICLYDEAASQAGGPFPCCKTTVVAKAPNEICEKE